MARIKPAYRFLNRNPEKKISAAILSINGEDTALMGSNYAEPVVNWYPYNISYSTGENPFINENGDLEFSYELAVDSLTNKDNYVLDRDFEIDITGLNRSDVTVTFDTGNLVFDSSAEFGTDRNGKKRGRVNFTKGTVQDINSFNILDGIFNFFQSIPVQQIDFSGEYTTDEDFENFISGLGIENYSGSGYFSGVLSKDAYNSGSGFFYYNDALVGFHDIYYNDKNLDFVKRPITPTVEIISKKINSPEHESLQNFCPSGVYEPSGLSGCFYLYYSGTGVL